MSYRTIKGLKNNKEFVDALETLYLLKAGQDKTPNNLSREQAVLLLSSAIVLLRAYELNKSYKSYAELGYDIILKYSLYSRDFEPLYDFSINFGFYPIAILLADSINNEASSLLEELSKRYVKDKFSYEGIVQTFDQKNMRDELLSANGVDEICLIAPTSYGKSSLIIDDILKNSSTYKRVGIVVPTKSLIAQTYKNIRERLSSQKIILHDEMFMNESSFVGVLTQERAMRMLLKNPSISFDKLYIDEAHNLFEGDGRVITLSRLIKLNRKRSPSSKIIYLSPLVADSDNLRHSQDQDIIEKRVEFNMKEPMYFNYSLSGELSLYNRFLDVFYELGHQYDNYIQYIANNSTDKNFAYLYAPKKIETFSKEISDALPEVHDAELDNIIKNISEHVHEDFYLVDYLKKGVVYLHGRMPDNVKDYLEYKFSQTSSLRYVVANKVVLEGINMPVTTLFILNTYGLDTKGLINLIGRVNRLNHIFSSIYNLDMLIPKVHFVNTVQYANKNSNMKNSITKKLRTGLGETDAVKNPLLYNFDISELNPEKDADAKKIKLAERVQQEERIIDEGTTEDVTKLRINMLQLGLSSIFKIDNAFCTIILARLNSSLDTDNILDTVYDVFIHDVGDYIIDGEFKRLEKDSVRAYYTKFIDNFRTLPMKNNINKSVRSFLSRVKNPNLDNYLYVGERLGEIPKPGSNNKSNTHIDLTNMPQKKMVNIAIGKLKIEWDFVSYKLSMIFQLLLDYNVISQSKYNTLMYGTDDAGKIQLMRLGLSSGLIDMLEKEDQLSNLSIDEHNKIVANDNFIAFTKSIDDFSRFEINKVFDISF